MKKTKKPLPTIVSIDVPAGIATVDESIEMEFTLIPPKVAGGKFTYKDLKFKAVKIEDI